MARDGYYDLSLDDARRVVNSAWMDIQAGRSLTQKQQRELVAIADRMLHHATSLPRVEVKDPDSTWWKGPNQ